MAQNIFDHWLWDIRTIEERMDESIGTRFPLIPADPSQGFHHVQTGGDRTNKIKPRLMVDPGQQSQNVKRQDAYFGVPNGLPT